jgi:hypothetical protein
MNFLLGELDWYLKSGDFSARPWPEWQAAHQAHDACEQRRIDRSFEFGSQAVISVSHYAKRTNGGCEWMLKNRNCDFIASGQLAQTFMMWNV